MNSDTLKIYAVFRSGLLSKRKQKRKLQHSLTSHKSQAENSLFDSTLIFFRSWVIRFPADFNFYSMPDAASGEKKRIWKKYVLTFL